MKHYSILIICEGENTEPLFFNSINDELIEGKYNNDLRKITLRIEPEPKIEEDELLKIKVPHKLKRKQRKTKKVRSIDKNENPISIISGQPPLRWVLTAQEQLKSGAFDEVWAVFDDDNHPAKKDAFEKAKEAINGKVVNIAYSSRSFEYYLLIHFQRVYRKFEYTDCKLDHRVFIRCGTNKNPEHDCKGEKCINGYAQMNKFWENSVEENTKNEISTYSIIKDKIETGFINSEWIRYKSNVNESKIPIHDRNPYLSIDKLVKRLIDNEKEYKWLSKNDEHNNGIITIKISNNFIIIFNISSSTIVLPASSIFAIGKSESVELNDKKVINSNGVVEFDISLYSNGDYYIRVLFENEIIMFETE